jgi:hypothetical protein
VRSNREHLRGWASEDGATIELLILVLIGGLLVLSQGSVLAPMIYTMF